MVSDQRPPGLHPKVGRPKELSRSISAPEFYGDLPPAKLNLAQYCLQKSAAKFPDKTALVVVGNGNHQQTWTYAQIEDLVLRLAGGFDALGLERGARVVIRMGNSFDYALAFFGANAAGLVPIPASSLLTASEIEFLISDSGARVAVDDGALPMPALPNGIEHIERAKFSQLKTVRRGEYSSTLCDEPAFLIYTSGTSAKPKGVLHAQRAVWGRRPMYKDWYDISSDDILLHTGAFNWTYTLGTGLFDPWANGATAIVYTGSKNINAWPAIAQKYRPTIMAAVPTLYRQILKYCKLNDRPFESLRHCLTAGEPLPQELQENWRTATDLEFYEALGMSEISTYISTSPTAPTKTGSPGRPQNGRAVAILPPDDGTEPVEIGETGALCIHRGDPALMLGYWNLPEIQAKAFRGCWFMTGDLAHMDGDGFVWFDGRQDDLMNAMGYRVSPVEIEAVLLSVDGVQEAGVCAIKVNQDVEIIVGFVVGARAIDIDRLQAHCVEHLAAYKVPKEFYQIDEIPRNARGKLDRKTLVLLEKQLRALP